MPILTTNAVQIARFANALYGIKLGSNTYEAVANDVFDLGLASAVDAYYNYSFGAKTAVEVADIILGNVGLTGNAAASAFIVGQLNAAGQSKGQAILSVLNAFANLTGDATFGAAATAWNNTVAAAQVYTASNPEDVAATATTIQTYVLHAGVEVVTRTAGNDTILAPLNTMDSFDVTDGGAGFDTLIIEGQGYGGTGEVSKGLFTNIEKVILDAFSYSGREINADRFQGVQQITMQDSEFFGLSASNLTDAMTFELKGSALSGVDLYYKPGATSSNIKLDALAGNVSIEIIGRDVATLNLSGHVLTTGGLPYGPLPTGKNGEYGVGIGNTAGKVTTVNVQTNDTMALDVASIVQLTKIDATASTGNVFSIINLADISSTGTSYGVTYLGGAGNDYVEANLSDLDAKDSLKGNAGDDTLLLNISGDNELANDVYTLSSKEYALVNKAEFEQIRFNGDGVIGNDRMALDASKITASKIGSEEDTVITKLENTDTVIFTNTVSDKTFELQAKRDVINDKVYAAGAGTVNLVSETKGVNIDVAVNDHAASDFTKLVVTGAGDVFMDNVHGYGVEIDASGLKGSLDVALSFDAPDKVTLGAGKDEIHLYAKVNSDVTGNSNALSDYGNMDTITGFATGFDKLVVADVTDNSSSAIGYLEYQGDQGVDFAQTVSLALMAASDAQKDVASFVWAGNTYVVQDNVTATSVESVFDPATDIVVKLTGVVSLVATDFVNNPDL